MTVLSAYAADLANAGDRLARRRVVNARRFRVTAIAVASLGALGAVGAAASTLWSPQLGDDRRGHPVASAIAPPADQLARLAVLRRAATTADQGEQVRQALSLFAPQEVSGIRTAYVRLVGPGAVLVPATQGFGKADALCLFLRDPVDGGGIGCFTTADVLDGSAVVAVADRPSTVMPSGPTITGPNGSAYQRVPAQPIGPVTITGLVPDGVAQVRLDGDSVTVHDNAFTLAERDGAALQDATSIQWLDAGGQPIAH